jgi:hypothetical protein
MQPALTRELIKELMKIIFDKIGEIRAEIFRHHLLVFRRETSERSLCSTHLSK